MKTQIIQLESHDDTISVRDKMDWSQTPRVLLEWPQDGKVLRKRLDLVLLERYCSANGSQLALVTNDLRVIHQAEEAGIPVFRSRSQAQLQPWGRSSREFARRELVQKSQQPRDPSVFDKPDPSQSRQLPGWARMLVFALAVLAVLAIGATLLPSATISLKPEIKQRGITIPVQAVPGLEMISLSGQIPVRELQLNLEHQASMEATGSLAVPAEYATGEVVFTNLGEKGVLIPLNTMLSTGQEDPLFFFTLSEGSTDEGKGSQISLPVQALEPGTRGNTAPNTITRINQDIGGELAVTNPESTAGGEDLTVPAPSEEDRSRLATQVAEELEQLALGEAQGQLLPGDILLSAGLESAAEIDNTYLPASGAAGETLTLTSATLCRIFYAAGEDLQGLAERAVGAIYPGHDYQVDPASIRLAHQGPPVFGQDRIWRWDMQVNWQEGRVFEEGTIIQAILGEDPSRAGKILQEEFALQHVPDIQLNPSWWRRIPALPFRIRIIELSE